MEPLHAYRILVILYRDGQLRRVTIAAPNRSIAESIAEFSYGEVVG